MKKRLKDKEFLRAKITIKALVEQYKDGNMTENRTKGFLITIDSGITKTSFREDDKRKIWSKIRKECYLL